MTREDNIQGGKTAQDKVYYCRKCGGIGQGSRMVHHHLQNDCGGVQGRKLKKATERNSHRLEEAIVNTHAWNAEKVNCEVRQFFQANQESVRAHIEELHMSIQDTLNETLTSYYKNIF